MRPSFARSRSWAPAALAVLLLAVVPSACDAPNPLAPSSGGDGSAGPTVRATLTRVSGDAQSGVVGRRLAAPVVVQVTDEAGKALRDRLLTVTVVSGGGVAAAPTVTTDVAGRAQVAWTLGTRAADAQTLHLTLAQPDSLGGARVAEFLATATPDVPAQLAVDPAGQGQIAPVGEPLTTPLGVVVTDRFGNPVTGITVTWSAEAGGGSVAPTVAVTDARGRAQTQRRAGGTPGTLVTQAKVAGLPPAAITGQAVARTDLIPSHVAAYQGDRQTGVAGDAAPLPYVARVTDQAGYPVEGASVRWTIVSGGGRLSADRATTNADGLATVTREFGTAAGSHGLIATVAGLTDTARFTATVAPDQPAALTALAGSGQTGVVGTPLPESLVVRLADRFNNAIPGATVVWTATGGVTLAPGTSTTDATGTAKTAATLGSTAGSATVSATAGAVTTTFTLTTRAALGATVTPTAGAGGRALPGMTTTLTVKVTDAFKNPVTGDTIAWLVQQGGGRVSAARSVTAADGTASTTFTYGPAGAQLVRADVPNRAFVGADLTLTSVAPTVSIVSGDGQTGAVGQALAAGYVIAVVEQGTTTPIANAPVTWAAPTGTVTGGATTDAQGRATATRTLGPTIGTQVATATVGGQTVSFQATAAGPNGEAVMVYVSGSGQHGAAGQPLAADYVVRVLTADGAPVAGHTVRWAIVPGSRGTLSVAQATTDGQGLARVRATLPDTAAPGTVQRVRATSAILPDTVVFTATVDAPSVVPTYLQKLAGQSNDGTPALPGDTVRLRVVVLDAYRAPIKGVMVTWRATNDGFVRAAGGTAGTGTASQALSATDDKGVAEILRVVGGAAAIDTTVVTAAGLAPLTFQTPNAAQPGELLRIRGGDGQAAPAGALLTDSLQVVATDAALQPLKNARILWAVVAGDGTVTATTTLTDDRGFAAVRFRVGSVAGAPNQVTASLVGTTATSVSVTFTATATAAPAGVAGAARAMPAP